MAYVRVRIPKYRVTKTGRIVKTGTITRYVHVKRKWSPNAQLRLHSERSGGVV